MGKKFLIVGSGLYGAVCARVLTEGGHRCLVLEKRSHLGGNCHTVYEEEAACHRHVYGPHIFHTDLEEVWTFINRFTRFNNFVNRPKVSFKGSIYSFPLNLLTLYQLFGVKSPQEARDHIRKVRVPHPAPANMEEWCLDQVGERIYETFIKGYTQKQWKRHPRELPASIIQRLPIRFTFDDNYFTHPHQGIPVDGYAAVFRRMLEGIPVELEADFLPDREMWLQRFDQVIYTGAIDAFFDHTLGPLEYRSLAFETELLDTPDLQGNAIVNYTEERIPYTRIVEHKHFDMNLTAQKTVVTREYPADWTPGDEPFYPVDVEVNRLNFARYRELAQAYAGKVTFGGRLGEYRYYDMDRVIMAALVKAAELV